MGKVNSNLVDNDNDNDNHLKDIGDDRNSIDDSKDSMRNNLCIEAQFSQGSWSRPGIAPRDLNNFLLNFTCTKDKMLYKFIVYLSHNQKTGQRPKRRGPGFPKMLSLALFSENFLLVYLWHLRNPSCRPNPQSIICHRVHF